VQAGTFALLAPTLSYLSLPEWQCPSDIFKPGECATVVSSVILVSKCFILALIPFCLQLIILFLLCDAMQSTVTGMSQYVVCLSIHCLSVMLRYRDHIGWNTLKIILRLISLRFMLGLTPTWAIWCSIIGVGS